MGKIVKVKAILEIETSIELNNQLDPRSIQRNPKKILEAWMKLDGRWYLEHCTPKIKVLDVKLKNKKNRSLID